MFNLRAWTLISIFLAARGLRYATYGLYCNLIGQHEFQLDQLPGPKHQPMLPDHLSGQFKMVAGSGLGTRLLVVVGMEVGVGMGVL